MGSLSLLLGEFQKTTQKSFSITYKMETNWEHQLLDVSRGLIDITPPRFDLTLERAEKVKYVIPCLFQEPIAFLVHPAISYNSIDVLEHFPIPVLCRVTRLAE